MNMARSLAKGEFTGWHMLFSIVAFFAVIVGVNLFMAFSATSTWTGLVVQNSYVASQEFNTKLATARQQREWGWQGGLEYADGKLVFALLDGDDRPIPAEEVSVELSRPIGVSGDQKVILPADTNGHYALALDLEQGVWNATIIARFEDQPDYEHRARFVVGGS